MRLSADLSEAAQQSQLAALLAAGFGDQVASSIDSPKAKRRPRATIHLAPRPQHCKSNCCMVGSQVHGVPGAAGALACRARRGAAVGPNVLKTCTFDQLDKQRPSQRSKESERYNVYINGHERIKTVVGISWSSLIPFKKPEVILFLVAVVKVQSNASY